MSLKELIFQTSHPLLMLMFKLSKNKQSINLQTKSHRHSPSSSIFHNLALFLSHKVIKSQDIFFILKAFFVKQQWLTFFSLLAYMNKCSWFEKQSDKLTCEESISCFASVSPSVIEMMYHINYCNNLSALKSIK